MQWLEGSNIVLLLRTAYRQLCRLSTCCTCLQCHKLVCGLLVPFLVLGSCRERAQVKLVKPSVEKCPLQPLSALLIMFFVFFFVHLLFVLNT